MDAGTVGEAGELVAGGVEGPESEGEDDEEDGEADDTGCDDPGGPGLGEEGEHRGNRSTRPTFIILRGMQAFRPRVLKRKQILFVLGKEDFHRRDAETQRKG